VNDIDNFEKDLERMLGQTIDAKLGTRRQPPVFVPQPRARQGARPWLIPLAAAACVVAVAVGTVGATRVLSEHRHVQPASPSPTVSAPAPSSTTSSSPSPTVSPSASRSSGNNLPAAPTTVTLGGAMLQLPPTWVARDYQEYLPANTSTLGFQAWCLTPAGLPASTDRYACPLEFSTIAAGAATNAVNVDIESGYSSDPHYCDNGAYLSSTTQSSDVDFGGRPSDHRRWVHTCHNGDIYQVEQYVVASGPGFVLLSEKADGDISAAMAGIVAHATLPAQTSDVRYYDHGYVQSVTPVTGGIRISVDRVVPATSGIVNNNPATYDYVIPAAVLSKNTPPRVGSLVTVFTDGSQVTSFYAG
jgi:hypothetical protein